MISISSFDSIDEIDSDAWEKVVGDDYLLSYNYLKHIEKTMTRNFVYHYLLVEDGKLPIAAVVLFEMRLDIATLLNDGSLKNFINRSRKVFHKAFTINTMFIGSPPSTGNFGISISEQCENNDDVIRMIINVIRSIAQKRHIKMILYKEIPEYFKKRYGNIFEEYGYCIGYDMPNNVLDICWESDEDYLIAMRSKSRQAIVRSSEKLKKDDISFGVMKNYGNIYTDAEYRMYLEVLHKSDNIFETLTKEYFSEFESSYEMDSSLLYISNRNKIIGYFLTCDVSSDTISALFAGINYDNNHDYDTYFNLFHQVIIYAIERKKKRIIFGQNTYEVKQRLGCTTEELYIAFAYKNKMIQGVLAKFSKYLLPKTEINARRVFK